MFVPFNAVFLYLKFWEIVFEVVLSPVLHLYRNTVRERLQPSLPEGAATGAAPRALSWSIRATSRHKEVVIAQVA